MSVSMTVRQRRRRLKAALGAGTLLAVSIAGAFAYRTIFARPGEAALKYLPSNVLLAGSIDLSPSPTQALAFKHIDDALSRNGLDRFAESSILDLIDKNPMKEEMSGLLTRGAAFCLEEKEGKKNDFTGLILIGVTDGSKALNILKKQCQPKFFRGAKYYAYGTSNICLTVVDDYLVLAESPQAILQVKQVQEGTLKPITSVPEFLTARERVASDANLLVFASARGWVRALGENIDQAPEWLATGVAIRDGGIGFSVSGKFDPEKWTALRDYASIPAVRSDLFQVLPSGAYGVVALSDLSGNYKAVQTSLASNKDAKKGLHDMEDSTDKAMGLSFERDLIPAFKGNSIVAVYPNQDGEPAGVDLLAVVDEKNGADAAAAAERCEAFVERQNEKEGNAPKMFTTKSIEGGTEYRINAKMEEDMRKSLGDGMNPSEFNRQAMVGKKTFVFATVGKTVLASTSQELLDRAVATYRSKANGLAADSKFATYDKAVLDGSQSMMILSISRMAQGFKNSFKPQSMKADEAKLFDSTLTALESLTDPLMIKGKATADGYGSAGVFVPMDYDRLIDIVGSQMKKK